MKNITLPIVIGADSDGDFVSCLALQGCYSQGDTNPAVPACSVTVTKYPSLQVLCFPHSQTVTLVTPLEAGWRCHRF